MHRFGVIAVLAAAVSLGGVSTVAAHGDGDDDQDVEVKVSKLVNGRCGHLEGSLPALITRTGIRPSEVVGDVTVCVANTGDDDAVLSLGATDLVDLDPACTGSEPTRDQTCGRGKGGELGQSLLQQVGLGACPSVPSHMNPAFDRRLPALQAKSLELVDRLREKQVVCVRLRLRYEPSDPAAAIASQSDRTFWRYAFTVAQRH